MACKVCHLSSAHRWYDVRIFQKEAKSLVKAGYDVACIVPHDREECREGVRLVPIPQPAGPLDRARLALWRIVRLALRENADVYHFHDPELIPAGLLLKLLGKRVIYDVHENYEQSVLTAAWLPRGLHRLVSLLWSGFERTAARGFDAIVVVDSDIRRKFPPHKTEMITNVPPLSFSSTEPKPARSGPFTIAYTGPVVEPRGVLKVVESLDHLRSKGVELHIFGEVEEPKHRKILDADPRVVCRGRLPWLQLRGALETADVGVLLFQPMPAHMAFTGEGNTKVFEFMGLGIPVLFADLPNLRKFMDTIGAGIAVDPTSPKKIAEAIDYLHDNPDVCRTLGEKGRMAVRQRFHWEKEEEKLLALYARVLSPKRQAPSGEAAS